MAIMRSGKAATLVFDSNSYIMTDFGSVRLPAEIDREYESARWRKNREIDMRFKRARTLAKWERLLHQRIYDYFRAHPDAPDDDVHKIPVPTLAEAAGEDYGRAP